MNFVYPTIRILGLLTGAIFFSFRIEGQEKIPLHGPAILAMNHQSYLDPPLAGSYIKGEMFYLAKKSLMENKIAAWILKRLNVIPVEREGEDRTALKLVIRAINQGNRILLFPEGTRTMDGSLGPAKAGIGLIASKTGAPVYPMRIFGADKALPRSGGGMKCHPIRIVVGDPIHFVSTDKPGRDEYQEFSNSVMDAIAKLTLPTES